ncbi:MAG: hypothetical protein COB36_11520 [Alphaproteobacteria bacterium]|nr:MAG: hypothetical protein COB36_11520 [Alphaproteobacteria bacterium]
MGIIVDNFAGGGGASTAMEEALGRNVDIAINHDADAIAMHKRNHPNTKHYCESVWDVDPAEACNGESVDVAWFSPDCKHFSRAAGGTPKNQKIRGLAWVVLKWAGLPEWQRPKIIYLENVSEFQTWQPITKRGEIDKRYAKGSTFRKWEKQLQALGYDTKYGILRADDFGAPTIRKRLFFVARCDGLPIVWPQATHGDPKKDPLGVLNLKPWKPASSIIDWSIPCKSIFERKKPLADNTLRRIAAGLKKFVIDNPEPFIVKVNHSGAGFRGQSLQKPLQTVTSKLGSMLVAPTIDAQYGESSGRDIQEPLGSVTAGGQGKQAVVVPIIDRQFGTATGDSNQNDITRPLGAVTAGGAGGKSALVAPYLEEFYTNSSGHSLEKPINTILSKEKHACVAPIIQHVAHSKAKNGCMPADEPMRTITATPKGGSLALTTAFIAQHNTGVVGRDADAPLSSVTATGSQQQPVTVMLGQDHSEEVTAFLMKYYGNEKSGCDIEEPLHTVTSKDRFGLITVHGKQYRIVDICMRMLTGRELFNAMDFPPDYDIMEGELTKTAIVAKAGNAVCKAPAKALVRVNSEPYMAPKLRVAA